MSRHVRNKNGTAADHAAMVNEQEECSDYSCCVFPVILAFMLGAFLRQVFQYIRREIFAGIPPRTVVLLLLGGAFAYACRDGNVASLAKYGRCTRIKGEYILHIALPLLVFQPTFSTEMQVFKKSLNQVLLLAVTGYAIMVFMTTLIFYLITFYPLIEDSVWRFQGAIISCIFAVCVCATDPLAVEDAVKVSGVTINLTALLQGESILGGAVAVVMYKFFKIMIVHDDSIKNKQNNSLNEDITLYIVECMFAPLFGILLAMLTVFWLSRIFNDATLEITIVLSVFHIAYYLSEMLRMPGMVTVLFFGLYLSSCRSSISHNVDAIMTRLFRVLADIYTCVVYFYAGVFMLREGNELQDWADIGWGIFLWIVINILRAIMVFFMSPVLRRLGLGLSWQHTLTVWVAGLNGCYNILLTMAAAENVSKTTIAQRYRKGSISIENKFFQAAIVIMFLKQFINTSLTKVMLRTFGLGSLTKFHKMSLSNAMRILKVTRNQTVNSLKSDRFMADAAFDIVEGDTLIDDLFKSFRLKRYNVTVFFRRSESKEVGPMASGEETDDSMSGGNRAESILMLIKAQKKTYWRHFDRGLMSKEALHQLLEWADAAADHKGKFLDVRQVVRASQVKPLLKNLKRQVKLKLRQLHHQKQMARGWLYWQVQVLPVIIGFGIHFFDTLLIIFAVALELGALKDDPSLHSTLRIAIFVWNVLVVGIYGMIALGEMLVMRFRFFKIVWHDIKLAIVVVGVMDLIVMKAVGEGNEDGGDLGHVFIRLSFILSRAIRLLGLVEVVPCILKKLLVMIEKQISGHLGVGFDICCGYVTGQVEVTRQLYTVVADEDTASDLKRYINRSKLDIIRTLGILALEHPTIALSVKTRQAIRMVLNAQHDMVKQLKMEGALEETDSALLTKNLEERMKKLLNSPPLVEDNSAENIIRNISWAQGDEVLIDYLQDSLETWILKPHAVITEQGREDFSVYIIKTGVARLEHVTTHTNMSVVDYMTAGNILGEINFLTKAPRHKTIRCETRVVVMVLPEEILEMALNMHLTPGMPPLLYRMWLALAKRVALKLFLDDPDYQSLSSEHLRMKMSSAYLMDNRLGSSISIHGDPADHVILVHGHAKDGLSRQPFLGPSLIPRTCFQLELLPEEGLYTLLLIIPAEPLEDVDPSEHVITPSRQGQFIDPVALATSASADALQFDDYLYCDNGQPPGSIGDLSSLVGERKKSSMGDPNRYASSSSSSGDSTGGQSVSSIKALPLPDKTDPQDRIVQPSRRATQDMMRLYKDIEMDYEEMDEGVQSEDDDSYVMNHQSRLVTPGHQTPQSWVEAQRAKADRSQPFSESTTTATAKGGTSTETGSVISGRRLMPSRQASILSFLGSTRKKVDSARSHGTGARSPRHGDRMPPERFN